MRADERVALTTHRATSASPVPTFGRGMLQLWVRSAFQLALVLSIPTLSVKFEPALNPQYEREEMARALERKQRSEGDPVVLPSGEVRRAVVYTLAPVSLEDSTAHSALIWWSRLMAAALLIGTIRQALRLRRAHVEHAARCLPARDQA